jgi:hypothetical protein
MTDGLWVYMNAPRPRVISTGAGSLPVRASSRSIQKSVPELSAS